MELNAEFHGEKNGIQFQEMGIPNNQRNGFKYENGGDNSDCYIVDLENFSNSNGVIDKEHNIHSSTNHANSRITLQRSLSRKVPLRGAERKLNDRDTLAPSSSPRAAQVISTPEMSVSPLSIPLVSHDHTINNHQQLPQHQITIKTGGINAMSDGRLGKRSSFKRSSYSWIFDPKRILLFFATLSSMGTMLLIYFTLAISKANDKESVLDWQ